ncbi:MAG: helix-turn-helix transcriptional regulator [Ruminococcaceae bacterium]|nr:helix-turn-helix transcriptional regulator [Oscillospiraceae bacterium]
MNSGERLKILREKHELTQSEVADYLKTSQSYYAQYENGHRPIPFERVVELSRLYDVSIDYIAGSTDDINRKPR